MADITGFTQGNVSNEGKVNWRGDQVSVTPGNQSIYETSSVPLADLGSRKVVGDRVFRYAKAVGSIGAGDVAESQAETLLLVTGGGTDPAGAKTFTWYAATAMSKDTYAEGYLIAGSGTAVNLGHFYRIKSHPAIAKTTNGILSLYDPLVKAENATDKFTLMQNPYLSCVECTTGEDTIAVGVAPVAVTTGDYFWLQTWGPSGVKCAAGTKGDMVVADVTGQVISFNNMSSGKNIPIVGHAMMDITASEWGLVFLQIAP